MRPVPDLRIRQLGNSTVNAQGDFVLYWMTSYRRPVWNFSLQRAVEWAVRLNRPLVILEALRCGYRWASDRSHQFVIQGMADNAAYWRRKRVLYYPYLEPDADAGKGLLQTLGRSACVAVSDDFPCFFLPRMYAAASQQIPVTLELVDSNGLLPMRAAGKVFSRAFDFRRFLQKHLPDHLDEFPDPDPTHSLRLPRLERLPASLVRRWPAAEVAAVVRNPQLLEDLPVDHQVRTAPFSGGHRAAEKTLRTFLDAKLPQYVGARNQPEMDATSGLSSYLHAGHISAHQVFAELMARAAWSPAQLNAKATGQSEGWWGASSTVEAFVDQLITWREIGFNMCSQRDDYDQFESLPAWAQRTLSDHADDPRPHVYTLDEFDAAKTHDPLWNAAQVQLREEGRMHNYLRMLWGKKILEWSPNPRDALQVMLELNNRYALDGRDPNSYSGIFWCLGRYDRAWGPERPIFGKVRYMSSENTARKLRVAGYVARYRRS